MPSTKEMIQQKAQELFAERGYDHVTLRDIADACGISQGNLTYHFPKKEDLVEAMISDAYGQLVDEMRLDRNDSVAALLASFRKMCNRAEQYYFYFREMNALATRFAVVKERQDSFHEIGTDYYYRSFQTMIEAGYLRPEIPDDIYRSLAYMLPVAQMSWDFSNAHVATKETVADSLYKALCASVYPFLTECGIEEWNACMGR